jgi:hypothetical protein
MMQARQPDLAHFLSAIPAEGLEPLKASLSHRANAMAADGDDPEVRAWISLYGFLAVEIETAQLRRLGITI